MRKELIIILALLAANTTRAQLKVEANGIVYVGEGAILSVEGDIDAEADIVGSGTVVLNGGSLQHISMNGFGIPNLQLDNSGNASLGSDARIGSRFIFNNGKMQLNAFDLYLDATAGIIGYDPERYFITNTVGRFIRRALGNTPFTFPVGSDGERYNPVTLTQSGMVHDIGVRTLPNVFSEGNSGMPLDKDVVNASWEVQDVTPGTDNLQLVAGWNSHDELPGFDRTRAGISHYEDGGGWNLAGSIPYTSAGVSLTTTGLFSVVTRRTAALSDQAMSVFPNPATSGFYVSAPGSQSVKTGGMYLLSLLDLKGQLMESREVSGADLAGSYFFSLGGKNGKFAAGIYMLQISYEGGVFGTKKIALIP
jgi:hypothetical protein